jgi:serine/threonine-protein kinase
MGEFWLIFAGKTAAMKVDAMQGDFEVGQVVGPYELIEKADALGLGAAYKVRNTEAGRIELMRVLPLELSKGLAAQRFLREANILQNLIHPNIVRLYRADQIDGRLFLTTELPEGQTLDQILQAGPLSLKDGVAHLCGILTGLNCAHAKNIVHRCVEPANIHVLSNSMVKINGFAFARGDKDPRLTSEGFVIGIAGYMSPEQVAGSQLDARSDLYSAAATLYEIVTGRQPFESKNCFQLMKAHLNESVVAPKAIRPDIPEKLDQIILKGLEKEPGRRFQTADEFRNELQSVPDAIGLEAAEKRAG